MNDEQLEQIRQILFSLRSELQEMERVFKESGETVELDQTRVGRLSRMDAMQTQQMALESARRRQRQLLKIDGALRRIESGEYGYCFVCGEEIDARRLFVDPTSTRCMECVE
jgi:DnaK suppressor protein